MFKYNESVNFQCIQNCKLRVNLMFQICGTWKQKSKHKMCLSSSFSLTYTHTYTPVYQSNTQTFILLYIFIAFWNQLYAWSRTAMSNTDTVNGSRVKLMMKNHPFFLKSFSAYLHTNTPVTNDHTFWNCSLHTSIHVHPSITTTPLSETVLFIPPYKYTHHQ